jgi:hypothetical protein
MLRASKTLQPENDTRRLNSMSMHAEKGSAISQSRVRRTASALILM